jgi:sporulation protein YlmC with PRC-barrel domain
LIGTVLGTCGFIVTLPVTIPLKKVDAIGKDLVIAPFHYTFERPLGKF